MEKEPRRERRGLDRQTLAALKPASLQNLTPTAGAHAAHKAVHLLILAVVRLKRALHTYTSHWVAPKDTCKIIRWAFPFVKTEPYAENEPQLNSPDRPKSVHEGA